MMVASGYRQLNGFDSNWDKRQRVRFTNQDATAYTDATFKVTIPYDSDMQADFEDLRFTDVSGTTTVPYWVESYTASTEAVVWVQVATLPASDSSTVFMYYDNLTATSTGSSTAVFNAVDDFEDGNITEYSGDTSLFTAGSSFNFGGSYGLDTSGFEGSRATDGIGRTDVAVGQGEIIRYMQYIDTTAGANDEVCTLFAVQSPVTNNSNYGVCIEQFGVDRLSIVEDAESTDTFGGVTVLASSTATYTTGWHEIEIDWQTDNTIDVAVYTAAGSLVATSSATDSTYTTGGIGFTYWGQNGGWDSYTARNRVETEPTIEFGIEQTEGGATWNNDLDTAITNVVIDDPIRLRFSVENSGLALTGKLFTLEYAPKGASPSCESVAGAAYATVPVDASCGSSPICMSTSTHLTDGDSTVDLLTGTAGTFVAGEAVADPSNQGSSIDLAQDTYSEYEFVIKPNTNVSDEAYCLRVSDNGTELDSYANVAEMTLQFAPTLGGVTLNNGQDIALSPGATTTILATTTVTDLNGFADLTLATTTFYRSGVGAACSADDNNCYISTGAQCSYTSCSGNSCELSCQADFYYHADPTDVGTFSGEEWYAFMEAEDAGGLSAFGTSAGLIDVLTLRALDVVNDISYGSLGVNTDTDTFNPTTTVQNLGNDSIDVQIVGTDMTDGATSLIPTNQQQFATTTFTYSTCTNCMSLSATGTALEVDLNKPTTSSPVTSDIVYWGIAIPFGTASNPHSGNNTFTAIGD